MFRNLLGISALHLLGFVIFSCESEGTLLAAMEQRLLSKRDATNMDCSMVSGLSSPVCLMLTPMPDETGVRATLLIGGKQIVSGMFSGRNPPGFPCIPILVPIMTAACLQQRDIRLTKDGFQTCPEAALINVAVVRFRCIVVSRAGVAFQTVSTPNTNGGLIEIDL